ncbi:DUF2066 domain-containing protein [Aliikangiella sp. IMCC44359]|uniref:DUF2066 domain-containing protein n=1 Tax=Aliikangiella sp. IMCC44359 TaxID=3459125 RepID=UPI00403A98F5
MNRLLGKITSALAIFACLAFCYSSQAVEVEGLYEVHVEVKNQSSSVRWKATLEGFKEVLVRKSGSEQVLSAYEVQQAYSKVTSYLQRYEYASNTSSKELPFVLYLNFAPRLVDELIQEAGMPIWGSNRPISILWLAIEENFKREIIKQDLQEGSFSDLLTRHTKRRGIPVILPLMDLEDQINVNISDIWGRFNNPIVEASERYQADSIVAGRVTRLGEQWQVKLSYINQGNEKVLSFSESTLEMLVATLSNRLAELLCEKYCVVEAAESHKISLQISNIRNFNHFKRVQHYLENLSSIRKVEVDELVSTVVRFNVSLLGDIQSVKDGIELGKKLIEEPEPNYNLFARTANQDVANQNVANQDNRVKTEVSSSEKLKENHQGALLENNTATDLENNANDSLSEPIKPTLESDSTEPVILYYRWVE